MKNLVVLGITAFALAVVFGWLWMIRPEVEDAEPVDSGTVGVAEAEKPPALSPREVDEARRAFEAAAAELPPELEAYQGITEEQFDRALREFRLSSWPVTLERAQGFESWASEEIWELGVDRYGWYPGSPPTDRTREVMLDRMRQDVRFEHYEDSLGYGAVRELGYGGEER